MGLLAGNSKFFSSFSSPGSYHFAAVGSFHSFSETMLVFSSSFGWLKCPFHCIIMFCCEYFAALTVAVNHLNSTISARLIYKLRP
jgi:hypothetical protein